MSFAVLLLYDIDLWLIVEDARQYSYGISLNIQIVKGVKDVLFVFLVCLPNVICQLSVSPGDSMKNKNSLKLCVMHTLLTLNCIIFILQFKKSLAFLFIRNCSMLKCKRIYEDLAPSVVCNTSSRVQKSHQSICQYVHMISLPSGQQNYAEQINPILNVSIQLISACTERQEINLFRISPLYFSGDFTQDAAVISINCSFLP